MEVKVIVDLRNQFREIRDQGKRPTCMAFAASDAHAFAQDSADPLSVEYAYYHAVRRRPGTDRNTGVSFEAISEAISLDGQPLESGWPYIEELALSDAWAPPRTSGTLFYRNATKITNGMTAVYASLAAGRPVVVVMSISISFFKIPAGTLLQAPATETPRGTHAVIVVGHGESGGDRCLLIRNSWGTGWGDGGYAWIDEDYLTPRLLVAGTMNS